METTNTDTEQKWYTLKVLSNFEDKVKKLIEKKLEYETECKKFFHEVMMPSEIVTSVKQGKKRATVRKLYPGYLFVRMNIYSESAPSELNPDAYYFITSINMPIIYIPFHSLLWVITVIIIFKTTVKMFNSFAANFNCS